MLCSVKNGIAIPSCMPHAMPSRFRWRVRTLQSRHLTVCESIVAPQKKRANKKERAPPLPNVSIFLRLLDGNGLFTQCCSLFYGMQPSANQQTLLRSFTLGGIGLHTGEYAYVCVKPAQAGEGRYFVRVPMGTNGHQYQVQPPRALTESQLSIHAHPEDGLDEESRAQAFLQYLQAEEEGYEGTFGEFVCERILNISDFDELRSESFFVESQKGPSEEAVERGEDEAYLPATVSIANSYLGAAVILEGQSYDILSPEAILSALEACGVDNARIEIETGSDATLELNDKGIPIIEVPVIDGSSLGWVLEVQKAGICDVPEAGARLALEARDMLTVQDDEAFITLYPGPVPKVTVGVDFGEPDGVAGRQWFSWSPVDSTASRDWDQHYRWEVAPARTVIPSIDVAEEMFANGLLRAGPEDCCLIGNGDTWCDPSLERFQGDEAARKGVADLLGILALAALPGGRGLPQGHIVAYKPTPELQLKFVKELYARRESWNDVQVSL